MIDTLSIVLRAFSFVAIFQVAGMAIFLFLFEKRLSPAVARSLRRTGIAAGLFALVVVAGHFALEPARMGGAISAVFDSGLRQIVLDSPVASAFSWRVGGLVVLLGGMVWWDAAPARVIALLAVSGVLLSFIQTGHTASFTPRPLLAGILLVHIAIAAFWFGSFIALRRIALDEPPANAGRLVESFSRLALILVPGLAVAGAVLACLLLGGWKELASPYGRLILVKIALFAVLMSLAAMNRLRLGPALTSGTPAARRSFIRAVLAEYVLVAAVLLVTAALTTLYSPES